MKPTVDNAHADMSPYGLSAFADTVNTIQAVDLAFDAMTSEVDNGKMRVFLSDVMFAQEEDGKGRKISIPFGRQDCTVFRKVMSTENTIQEFAPQLLQTRRRKPCGRRCRCSGICANSESATSISTGRGA